MRYFLSYVESGIHASVMLSTQESSSQPVKVSYEAGFDISGKLQSPIGTQQGYYVEEEAASKAAYSSIPVKHRTFEITEEEAKRFFLLINEQRSKRRGDDLSNEESQSMIRGPQFQLLTKNCKVYALSIFKELGIYEASSLSNAFVQITRTNKDKMKEINQEVITCPIKDKFMRDFENLIKDLESILPELENLAVKDKSQPKLKMIVKLLKNEIPRLRAKTRKIGIETKLYQEYQNFLSVIKTDLKIPEDIHPSEETEFKLKNIYKQSQKLSDDLKEIKRLDKSHSLPFEWQAPPEVAKRVKLQNLSEEEKAIYAINQKSDEITDGLNDISIMLQVALQSKSIDQAAKFDLLALNGIVQEAKLELKKSEEILDEQLKNSDPSQKSKAYIKRQEDLEKIIKDLDQKISNYQPRHKSSNLFIKFFKNVIHVFKKESSIIKRNPKKILFKRVKQLEQKTFIISHGNVLKASDTNKKPVEKANKSTSLKNHK